MIKMLRTTVLLLALGAVSANAQVGMPTNNPQRNAQLDLNGANSQNNKGLLLPRVSLVATDNVAPLIGTVLSGMKVYNLATAGSGATAVTPGEYYYDGTKWVRIAAEGSGASGAEPWYDVTTQAGATANTQDIYQIGKVGIGKNNPQAQLDVSKDALINGITVGLAGGQVANNTAVGNMALKNNTTGFKNVAMGNGSLNSNTNGVWNSAMGSGSLQSNTGGSYNSAIGVNALLSNTTGNDNLAVGVNALYYNLANNNVAMGSHALYENITGNENSAMGSSALKQNKTGKKNTAVGIRALQANTTADYNTAIGADALVANTTGTQNSAVGTGALANNKNGSFNTSMGVNSLLNNATGTGNSAFATNALTTNTTGDYNQAIGVDALQSNTTGSYNSAIGRSALNLNTVGKNNVAIGNNTLGYIINGNYNTAIGIGAGTNLQSGDNNIFLGNGAVFPGVNNISNVLSIGNIIFGSNINSSTLGKIGIGTSTPSQKLDVGGSINVFSGNFFSGQRANYYLSLQNDRNIVVYDAGAPIWISGTGLSDIRTKTDITAAPSMLDRVNKLQVVNYKYKAEIDDNNQQRVGVIAQELLKEFPEYKADLIYHDEKADRYVVHYDKLTVLLLKSLQDQQAEIEAQQSQINIMKKEIEKLKWK